MREVANSRLILLSPLGSARQWVLGEFSRHGISADRIRFEHKLKRRNYLELYHQIDLVLDTYIYNGHTTSLDGLWMGVPMVTRYGQPAVSRAGLSQLTNLNLQHLASDTEAGFIANAVSLASDLPALRNLRKTLRSRIEASPLMDAKKFARGFEDVCRSAWRTWCET
jgi:predicted O-linked N-acetylglucosamine transferase (SPINDLY family)